MSKFVVRFDGTDCANDELYIDAIAGGERSFAKMLAKNEAAGKPLFDQVLYPLTREQLETCARYIPTYQDFDEAYRYLNVLSRDTLGLIKKGACPGFPEASVISLAPDAAPELFQFRHVSFFRVQDFKEKNYAAVPKMAAVKICGRLYIGLNAVDVRTAAPIVVAIDG